MNALPKQRVAEISRRIDAFEQENPNYAGGDPNKPVSARNDGSRSARSRSRGHSAKRGPKQANKSSERNTKSQASAVDENEAHPSPSEQVFLFNTKKAQAVIPGHFQASLSQIIMTIKNISQDRDRLRAQQI